MDAGDGGLAPTRTTDEAGLTAAAVFFICSAWCVAYIFCLDFRPGRVASGRCDLTFVERNFLAALAVTGELRLVGQ